MREKSNENNGRKTRARREKNLSDGFFLDNFVGIVAARFE